MRSKELNELMEKEGNLKEFEYKGMRLTCRRHKGMGHWCGYVEVPTEAIIDIYGIKVHGGVTFDDFCDDGKRRIGFDCAHCWDIAPFHTISYSGGVYRDLEYVINECKSMADQIIEQIEKHEP
jgi:hypothetical protein